MKLNQILISLEEYDALREFKSNIEKGNTYYSTSYIEINGRSYTSSQSEYITESETVAMLEAKLAAKEIERCIAVGDKLLADTQCRQAIGRAVDLQWELGQMKRMTIREFLKWRKSK